MFNKTIENLEEVKTSNLDLKKEVVMKGLFLAVALVIVGCQEVPSMTSMKEAKNVQQAEALKVLQVLWTLPDNPKAQNSRHNVLLKQSAAETAIYEYALRRMHGFPVERSINGKLPPEKVVEALDEF